MQHIRSLISISFMAIVLVALPYSPAEASGPPSRNGWIAYETGGDIWIVNPINAQGRLLEKHAQTPRWSPDGQKLAFINRQGHLHIKALYNTRIADLTKHRHTTDSFPAWSSNGSRLAFVRTEQSASGTKNAIFTVDSFGKNETNVLGWSRKSTLASPSWSPDGTQLAFEKQTGDKRELIIRNMLTGKEHVVTTLSDDIDSHVSWSPNGKKLLYSDSRDEIYTIWTDGSHRAVISDGESYQASWSPDGAQIAFIEDPEDKSISISGPDGSISYVSITESTYHTIGTPSWSPDSRQLLFAMQTNRNDKAVFDLFTVELRRPDQLKKLAENVNFDTSWQPIR